MTSRTTTRQALPRASQQTAQLELRAASASEASAFWGTLTALDTPGRALPEPVVLPFDVAATQHAITVLLPSDRACVRRALVIAQQLWNEQTPCLVVMPDDVDAAGPDIAGFIASDASIVFASDGPRVHRAAIDTLLACSNKSADLRSQLAVADTLSRGMSGEMDRLQEELQLAATVQRESLPRTMPEVPGYEVAVLYRPQGFLSGDTYDVLRLDDDTLGVFIADAVGHGAPAALMTMVLARSLQTRGRRNRPEAVLEPAFAVARLNGALMQRTRQTTIRFATAAYLTLGLGSGRVAYASAGHPHALVYADGSLVREVESQGPMLGVFPGAEFPESVTMLEPGETLVVHSDGFEQVFGDEHAEGDQRGYRSAFGVLSNSTGGSLDDRMGSFTSMLDGRAGSLHQVDDLTLIAITRTTAT